ncbi:MAG: hypothetical protein GWN62_15835 [Aliifodinibius sp.]|nr:hypothetical protein [Fodinibius sp.]
MIRSDANIHAANLPWKIYGVDFSGATSAGKYIWLSCCEVSETKLLVHNCISIENLTGCGPGRDGSIDALRQFVAAQTKSMFGFDFPFSIPAKFINAGSWTNFVLNFSEDFSSAEKFRQFCRDRSANVELKRVTDRESRVPFSPYNLRIYRQTYYGIRDLLAPLMRKNNICVLPMHKLLADKPLILETCPASFLKRMNRYHPYKGKAQRENQNRKQIVEFLIDEKNVQLVGNQLKSLVLENHSGDALDSLLAACILFDLHQYPERLYPPMKSEYFLEGYVYF